MKPLVKVALAAHGMLSQETPSYILPYLSIATSIGSQVSSLNQAIIAYTGSDRGAASAVMAQASVVMTQVHAGAAAVETLSPFSNLLDALFMLPYYQDDVTTPESGPVTTGLAEHVAVLVANFVAKTEAVSADGLCSAAEELFRREKEAADGLVAAVLAKLDGLYVDGVASARVISPIASALDAGIEAYRECAVVTSGSGSGDGQPDGVGSGGHGEL